MTTQPQPTALSTELPFGLSSAPFADCVDDAFFFPSDQHLRALEFMGQLLWTRARLGVVTASHGCGKSLLISRLLHSLDERIVAAAVSREHLSPRDFLLEVLRQYGFALEDSDRTDFRRLLERFLHHQASMSRVCLLVVENPQEMHPSVLEELRCLAAVEVEGRRVLKVLLLGQPALNRVIESPKMIELLAAGINRFTLGALTEDQTAAYIAHRLRAAGAANPDVLMPYTLMFRIHACTGGIPRQVNRLGARALACAAEDGAASVTPEALNRAIAELGWQSRLPAVPVESNRHKGEAAQTCGKLILSMQGVPDRELILDHDRMLVGRGEEADIRIDSVFVSRYHALIVRHDHQDLLLDLGSTNGVLLASRRILRRVLKDGDVIQIGPARVTYLNPLAVPAAQPDPAETICFARPGFPPMPGEDDMNGTVIAFGQIDGPNSGGR